MTCVEMGAQQQWQHRLLLLLLLSSSWVEALQGVHGRHALEPCQQQQQQHLREWLLLLLLSWQPCWRVTSAARPVG
jgi:hypothetical protein